MALMPADAMSTILTRAHTRRLREVYRSAGWPFQDLIEIELLSCGMLERRASPAGHETVRVTDAGIQALAENFKKNQKARSRHEDLVGLVAREMARSGRVAWRGLMLRARLPAASDGEAPSWCVACPDVFSIRNTSMAAYVEPIVHEIKVSRADLLSDLRNADKRAAYLEMGGQCWYVLGQDARGRPIGDAGDVPIACGVMAAADGRLSVLRNAPRKEVVALPFHVWMALAKATPCAAPDEDAQQLLDAA